MSDTVTASAVATGDVAAVQARESALAALFHRDRTALRADPSVARALDDVVDTPTIGAVAAIEMARLSSGWSVEIGAANGLARYQAFAAALTSGGWFVEDRGPVRSTLPDFRTEDPVASLMATVAVVHPDLAPSDQLRIGQALVRALEHTLGPDGVPATPAGSADGVLGSKEVLERRVTTVASNVLGAGDRPVYAMAWRTEIFERTKEGKDDPKAHREQKTHNHRLVFELQRWREGDRSALLDYYRYVDDWLKEFNSSGGRPRSMVCFSTLMA